MSRLCQLTNKKATRGRTYATRGIAKKKKGIGLKTTGISLRNFRPNLVKKRFWLSEENRFVTLKVSCAAMRTIDKRGITAVVHEMRKAGQKI